MSMLPRKPAQQSPDRFTTLPMHIGTTALQPFLTLVLASQKRKQTARSALGRAGRFALHGPERG